MRPVDQSADGSEEDWTQSESGAVEMTIGVRFVEREAAPSTSTAIRFLPRARSPIRQAPRAVCPYLTWTRS